MMGSIAHALQTRKMTVRSVSLEIINDNAIVVVIAGSWLHRPDDNFPGAHNQLKEEE
jgi:hypothetical protein